MKCFECGASSQTHFHHVIPRSKGGEKTIPLCEKCHSKVHSANLTTSYLTRISLLRKAKEEMCRIFYLITVDQVGYKTITEDLSEFMDIKIHGVRNRVKRLMKLDIEDMLDVFSEILQIDSNMFYDRDFFRERWSFFLDQIALHYTKRICFND